jgi:hypothetical protein
VVFIKELVPRLAIAFIARAFYNENYIQLPMSHRIDSTNTVSAFENHQSNSLAAPASVRYSWRYKNNYNFLSVTTRGTARPAPEGSQQEFITEHYWGYVTQRDRSTKEYRVEHPRWHIWETGTAEFHCDIANLYGNQFCDCLSRQPSSAFLADGSDVKLYNDVKMST